MGEIYGLPHGLLDYRGPKIWERLRRKHHRPYKGQEIGIDCPHESNGEYKEPFGRLISEVRPKIRNKKKWSPPFNNRTLNNKINLL